MDKIGFTNTPNLQLSNGVQDYGCHPSQCEKMVKTIKSDNKVIFAVPYECVLCDTRLPGIEELIQTEEENDKKGRTFDELVARAHETWREDYENEKKQARMKQSGM